MTYQQSQQGVHSFTTRTIVLGVAIIGLMCLPSFAQIQDVRQPLKRKQITDSKPPGESPAVTIKDGQLFPAPPADAIQSKTMTGQGDGVLITWPFQVRQTVLAELTNNMIATADGNEGWIEQPLNNVVALVRLNPRFVLRAPGAVTLIDGQRFPGEPNHSDGHESGQLAWRHPWLGPMNIPLEGVSSVALDHTGVPVAAPGAPRRDGDAIFLANGDELEGFLMEIGTMVKVETSAGLREVPIDQVRAIQMMPDTTTPTGRRVTFRDGTIIDVEEIRIGLDGYTRLTATSLNLVDGMPPSTELPRSIEINSVAFEPAQFQSLTTIEPSSVTGPPTRFHSEPPWVSGVGPDPLLGRLDIQGPVSVTYDLPAGASNFTSLLGLDDQSPPWAHLEIVVSVDGQQQWKTVLSHDLPTAIIDIPIEGRQLTFTLSEGNASSTGDRIVLVYPLIRITDSLTN